mmetsp:Transcript_29236/g.60787  ORF Transcript_29236/g.60787 Transcript_29236/m.60787 type:complete len:82 (-) Transcript_29236:496-741(-)
MLPPTPFLLPRAAHGTQRVFSAVLYESAFPSNDDEILERERERERAAAPRTPSFLLFAGSSKGKRSQEISINRGTQQCNER